MEQQAGCFRRLRRRWRRSRGRATAAPRHRVADGADPQRRSHPVSLLGLQDSFSDYLVVIKDGKPLSELEHLNQAGRQMLDQMAWWTAALKAAREKSLRQAA